VSYRVDIDPSAGKDLDLLPGYVRAQALQMFRLLKDKPKPPRAKELRGKPGTYRIWLAGRWRIAYQVDDAQQVIIILRVRLKEDIDYDSLGSPE
jgi:mRNA-degrading endonuclease RelE of RelBE toxin-antitoxin system